LNGNKLRVFSGFRFIITAMTRGANMKKLIIAVIALNLIASPNAFAEEKPTNVDTCKAVKSKPRTPTKLPAQKSISTKKPTEMTMNTNCGKIVIALESQKAPITISKLSFLASNKFFDGTLCHRLTTSGIYVLQCGDPTATGRGGPIGWKGYVDENLPKDTEINYPAGTIAMANGGPNTNGSQFFLVYKDSHLPPNYTIWGTITSGLEILNKVAEVGAYQINKADKKAYYSGDGYPIQAVEIKSVTFK
jgi:peptidyl-prolyl cis-trans isomerase B (cyclophilin B)